jgi:predicted nucleic acid-binding protein
MIPRMTKLIFFDTDSISAFFWVKREDLLLKLYPGRIVLPKEVYNELTNPRIPHIASRVKELYHSGQIMVRETLVGSDEYTLYYELADKPPEGEKRIGRGEAAAIAMAAAYDGVVASNNIKDILPMIDRSGVDHTTTGKILKEAMDQGLITEEEGNEIWTRMRAKKRQLPSETFTGFLQAGF